MVPKPKRGPQLSTAGAFFIERFFYFFDGNCSDWGETGFGEDGVQGMVGVGFLQTPGTEQGSHDALGLAPLLRTGAAADLPAHHRWPQAPFRCVIVRAGPGLGDEGEEFRQEAFHSLAQRPHGRVAAQVRLAYSP